MNKLTIAIFLFLFSPGLFAQEHKLIKKWETDSLLKVPESVLPDAKNNVLYVTNIDGTDPWEKMEKDQLEK